MTREILPGETIHVGPGARKVTIIGDAHSTSDLVALQGNVGDKADELRNTIVTAELDYGRLRCSNEACELKLLTSLSDDALPSEAVFQCSKKTPSCANITSVAAERSDKLWEAAAKRILDSIEESLEDYR
jgi:hypothetical protein